MVEAKGIMTEMQQRGIEAMSAEPCARIAAERPAVVVVDDVMDGMSRAKPTNRVRRAQRGANRQKAINRQQSIEQE